MKRLLFFLCLLALLPLSAGAEENMALTVTGDIVTVIPGGEADNDKLFDAYVGNLFSGPRRTDLVPKSVGDRLTGAEAAYYSVLKAGIEAVAAGERTSTIFEVTLDSLGLQGKYWTAEELGVDVLLVNGNVTQEALGALAEKVAFRLDYLLDVLLADCPYSLYWYDKTLGTSALGFSYTVRPSTTGGVQRVAMTATRNARFYFKVHESYATAALTPITEQDENGGSVVNSYHFETAPGRVAAANAAVARAGEIVAAHAGESDYDKLQSYKREICDLAAYDYAAGDAVDQYGDPWQLVYVFDGDPATKVVCEGYSKALQYLCERSAFREKITCYSVTGWMRNSAKGHMWNLITMPDGMVYHADVTNSDEGTVGANGGLFLVGVYLQVFDENKYINEYVVKNGSSLYNYKFDTASVKLYSREELTLADSPYRPVPTPPDPGTLTAFLLPDSLDILEESALEGVPVQRIVLPEGLTAIGSRAFADCPNLVYINLPDSLQSIDATAFAGCSAEVIFVFCGEEVASMPAIAGNEQLYVIVQ